MSPSFKCRHKYFFIFIRRIINYENKFLVYIFYFNFFFCYNSNLTVFSSFFENTSNYYQILKDTFLLEYILNSLILLLSVLILTFLIGTGSAYLVSFFEFPFSNFFKWALILSLQFLLIFMLIH